MMTVVTSRVLTTFLPVVVLLATATSASPRGKRKRAHTRVAVLQLGALGMSTAMRKNLELLVTNSIATMPGYRVIPSVDIQMAMGDPRHKTVAKCGGGPDCAVQIGKVVGADLVVFGTISTIGEAFSLDLRAMDVKRGKAKGREKSRISGTRDLLIPEVRLATYRLIAPDRIRGSLLIDIDVEGVEVEIDGESVGLTPLEKPVEDLTPGSHVVVLKRPGFSEFRKEFVIKPFETARLKLELGKAETN